MQEKNILINIYVHIYWKLETTKIVRNKYNVCDYKYQIKHYNIEKKVIHYIKKLYTVRKRVAINNIHV